jgi:hypothetical protein
MKDILKDQREQNHGLSILDPTIELYLNFINKTYELSQQLRIWKESPF